MHFRGLTPSVCSLQLQEEEREKEQKKGDWVKQKYFAWRRALWAVTGRRRSVGRVGLGAWYLHCFDALHGVECAISQRLNVVVVQREQAEAVQVAEGILAYAGDLVGIQQQQLQRAESFEHARG